MSVFEYRGVRDLVYAEVTCDDNETGTGHGYVTGTVKTLAPVAEIGRQTASSQETKYYDNVPAMTINSTGADTVTISVAGVPLDVVADITGQTYSTTYGAMFEGERTPKYFAIGYKTKRTDGTEMYVWRLKGSFAVPDETSATEDDGTNANGQTLVYTGISTTKKFTNNGGKGAKSVIVDTSLNLVSSLSTFFSTVKTPDTLTP